MIVAIALSVIGTLINAGLLAGWIRGGLRLKQISYPGLVGMLLIILGFQTFVFTLLFQMINARHERADS
jgi:hypothetical protein